MKTLTMEQQTHMKTAVVNITGTRGGAEVMMMVTSTPTPCAVHVVVEEQEVGGWNTYIHP